MSDASSPYAGHTLRVYVEEQSIGAEVHCPHEMTDLTGVALGDLPNCRVQWTEEGERERPYGKCLVGENYGDYGTDCIEVDLGNGDTRVVVGELPVTPRWEHGEDFYLRVDLPSA